MLPTEQGPSKANVLGVGISAVDMAEALRRAERLLDEHSKGYLCLTGVHGIMEARRDPELRRILNHSLLCLPDGMPTVWVGRLQGLRGIGRVYGPDFMMQMCQRSVERRYRHFLLGGKAGVVDLLQHRLETLVPGLAICGTYTPPFRPLTSMEESELVTMIANARPDIVWIGLSTPKQERFMATYCDRLDTVLMVGVGAAFDIHAGLLADAPRWMKGCGLQWLHRFCIEPRRLWRRYLTNNPRFLWDIALQVAGLRKFEIGESEG